MSQRLTLKDLISDMCEKTTERLLKLDCNAFMRKYEQVFPKVKVHLTIVGANRDEDVFELEIVEKKASHDDVEQFVRALAKKGMTVGLENKNTGGVDPDDVVSIDFIQEQICGE